MTLHTELEVSPVLTSAEIAKHACNGDGSSDSLRQVWKDIDQNVSRYTTSKVSGGMFLYPRQAKLLKSLVSALASSLSNRPLRVCETGFGAGHSTALFLDASPNVEVYTFDKFDRPYQLTIWKSLNQTYDNKMQYFRGDSCWTVPRHLSANDTDKIQCDVLHGSSLCKTDNVDLVENSPCGALLTSTAMNHLKEYAVYFGPKAQWRKLRSLNMVNNITCFTEATTKVDKNYVFGRRGDVISHKFCMGVTTGATCDDQGDFVQIMNRVRLEQYCPDYQVPAPP